MTIELGPISTWFAHAGETGTGTYLLTGYGEYITTGGQTCLKVTLEDADSRATGFVWPEARGSVVCAATPAPVRVTGTVQQFQDHPQLKLHALVQVDPDQVESAVALLPRRRCPEAASSALVRLARLEHDLPEPLSGCLRQVLLDPALGVPFLRCRASVHHHHAYPGGLLVHSTEMLDAAAAHARRTLPDDGWAPYLAQVAYLLHDLGKLRSVGELRRSYLGLVVPHEILTVELLAPHLHWLEQRDRELAAALRYVFSYLATPAVARKCAEYFVAELVVTLDQWSAAGHNRRDLAHLLHPVWTSGAPARHRERFDPADSPGPRRAAGATHAALDPPASLPPRATRS